MYFKWNGKKIGWYGQEFSQSFLPTANFLCLQVPPFLLLPVQNLEKKGNCWHHFSHKSVEIEGIQEEQDFLLTHQVGKTDDLVKWNLLSTFHVRNTSWHLPFLTPLISVHEGEGNIVGQFMFLGQQHYKAILMPHMALQVLEGTC